MSDIKFAETHNLVAFLEKPTESEGFEEIVDFLNANPIKYALTINPTTYTLCIQQFWATTKAKTINGEDTEVPQPSDSIEAIADEAPNVESVPTHSNDPLHSVLDLKTTKTSQAVEINKLKEMVKKLEKKGGSRTHRLRRLYKVGRSARVVSSKDEGLGDQEDASKQGRIIDEINQDAEVTLVDENFMFDTGVLDNKQEKEIDVAEKEVSNADPVTTAGEVVTTANVEVTTDSATTTTVDELTLAQTLIQIKAIKPKVRGVMMQEPSESGTRTTIPPLQQPQVKDKGKAKMIEPEKPLKMKEQIILDEELALKLQAEEEEQTRLAREKAEIVEEANISWDNVQAMIEANRTLREEKEHFAALKTQEKRNKPPTKAQKKSTISTYLKHMAGYNQSQLKNKSFTEIQKLFDKAMTRVNMFVDMDIELVKESSKKAEAEMAQESSSKREKEDDEIVGATPLSVKIPIVDYKIHKKGKLEDLVWRNLQGKTILLWRLYDSCGIHFVRFEDMHVHMLVEKRYPLTPATITAMLNKKLQAANFNEITYQLLKLLTK
ncbi:hypothetical protein Tco_0524224 [Tanacetum coccineum]